MEWFAAGYLGINAWTDIRNREIDLRITAGAMGLWLLLRLLGILEKPERTAGSFLPCLLLLFISRIRKGSVGMGDVAVAAVMAVIVPQPLATVTFLTGMILAGIWGCVQLRFRRKSREIPLVPFLLAGYLAGWIL